MIKSFIILNVTANLASAKNQVCNHIRYNQESKEVFRRIHSHALRKSLPTNIKGSEGLSDKAAEEIAAAFGKRRIGKMKRDLSSLGKRLSR